MWKWFSAKTIFQPVDDDVKDLVTWSVMISCFSHNGMESQALLTFVEMLSKEYARIGEAVFGFLIKIGYFRSDICVGCALIDSFTKVFCDLEYAKKVFDQMPERNSVMWNLMITRFG
ncbi:pentatricopeptide repeat-containing protein [Tanacetum coccineum]|uniref:Pentatricopeptide repeat-containing protein n=1 Tax=Tanacetum coccineum TaxID=301880 RepID=A0ABQ4XQU8_9ASTR